MQLSSLFLLFNFLPIFCLKAYKAPKLHPPYWSDPRIHMFGNDNLFHANIAPFFTHVLDRCVYKENLRNYVCETYLKPYIKTNSSILDIGCGTGISTESIATSFRNCSVIGIDTSTQMLKVASRQRKYSNIKYEFGNGHYYTLNNTDMSFISFVFHEVPRDARLSMLRRLSKSIKTVVVLDISQDYIPSRQMLYGEPYLYDYLEHINTDIENIFKFVSKYIIVPNHATLWIATNNQNISN